MTVLTEAADITRKSRVLWLVVESLVSVEHRIGEDVGIFRDRLHLSRRGRGVLRRCERRHEIREGRDGKDGSRIFPHDSAWHLTLQFSALAGSKKH